MNEKRIHFKGRGKTERPVCPDCQEDLKRSYKYEWDSATKKGKYSAYGWYCNKCKIQTFD